MRLLAALLLVTLAGCWPYRSPAPVEDRRPPPSRPAVKPSVTAQQPAAAAPEGFYIVKRGDTLYSIALEHGHDYRELAQWNSLDDPTRILAGQMLRVTPPPQQAVAPGSGAVTLGSGPSPSRIESRPLEGKPPVIAAPTTAPQPQSQPQPQAQPAPAPAPAVPSEALTFTWPAKGKLLAGFAEPRQKGIDIGGKVGDPVLAAAAGRVTYVGSGIPGLGNLVVIKHDHGFITVYGHNRNILVKEQQNVARGQPIAALGEKLHFQIRKGAAAVDPLLYLPRS